MPESRGLKEKARHFLDKYIDIYENSKNNLPKPPATPPKPTLPTHGPTKPSSPPEINHITATFNGLSISNPSTPVPAQMDPSFIGGFNLAGASSSAPALSSPSNSRPCMMMPIPHTPSPGQQSLTMQIATRPDYDDFVGIPSTPQKPSRPQKYTGPNASTGSSPPTNLDLPSIPVTPVRPSNSPGQSLAPSRKTGQVQCAGITKAGKRCTRQVKIDLSSDDTSDEEESVAHFCFQHTNEILVPSGYYARKNGIWVQFEDWIPPYLRTSTQASLRAEMEKAKSARDVPGYIYTFEIRDPDAPKTTKLKVGRAVNLVKRIDQWGKQCGSKEQVLRGFYPGNVEEDESSLMKGRVQAGEKAAWCHRLERLIHIELADLASTCVYLETGWPSGLETPPSTSTVPKMNGRGNGGNEPCPDCGSMHKEIFEFRKWERGKLKGKEWEQIVKPVVERWGRFVDLYV